MSKTVTAKTYLAIKSAALAIGVIAISLVSCEPEPEPEPEPTLNATFNAYQFPAADPTIQIYAGDSIRFISTTTYQYVYGRFWNFPGGTPDTGVYENDEPITDYIKYLTPGTYDVTLIVIGALGSQSDTNTRAGYVIVLPDTNTTTGCGTEVTDIDGNVYDVVEIGSQCWMKQNLKTATYNDGTPIPTGLDDVTWSDDSTDAYAVYDNNPVNADTFGYAYNWYAVNTGKLCPQGWHIPTQAEFETLIATIGGEAEGGALKLTDLWQAPNVGATNNSGFSAAGSGFRVNSGIYYGVGLEGHFWSSTESLDGGAYNLFLRNDDSYVYLEGYPFENGFSCRCIKD